MPRKKKPEAVCDGDSPLTPITAKEREEVRRVSQEMPGGSRQGCGFYHPFHRRRHPIFQCAFQGQDGLLAPLRMRHQS